MVSEVGAQEPLFDIIAFPILSRAKYATALFPLICQGFLATLG